MSNALTGRYFFPGSARFVPARAILNDGNLRVEDEAGTVLSEVSLALLEISPRLGNLPRRLALFDGGRFETDDNDAADSLFKGKRKSAAGIHRFERSWRWAGASLLFAGLVVYAFIIYGIPTVALLLA